MPGVTKDEKAEGTYEKVKVSKISLGSARTFTKIVDSDDVNVKAVSFEFFYTDKNLVGVNATIEFHLESSNGLVSQTY